MAILFILRFGALYTPHSRFLHRTAGPFKPNRGPPDITKRPLASSGSPLGCLLSSLYMNQAAIPSIENDYKFLNCRRTQR